MLFLICISSLLTLGDSHLVESRYRGSNAGDNSWLDKGTRIGDGSYKTYGKVKYEDDLNGYNDRDYGGRARYGGRGSETCPHDNIESRSRGKRETIEDKIEVFKRNTEDNELLNIEVESLLLNKLRRKRHEEYYPDKRYYGRNRDNRYNGRNRDNRYNGRNRNYNRDHYGRDNRDYRDYNRDNYGRDNRYDRREWRDSGVVARDRCGRTACRWEAELVCDRDGRGGRSYGGDRYPDRGYRRSYDGYAGREDRYREDRYRDDYDQTWVRVNDAYYPRGKYNDLQEYFSGRLEGDTRGNRLIIKTVKAEDKGIYRCYNANGEFTEVKFYPKYPLSSNDGC